MESYLSDNSGHRVPPHPGMCDPVAASGLVVTCTSANTNYTQTVTEGALYHVVAGKASSADVGEIVSMSITGTAVTDANKEWNFGIGGTGIVIFIPVGKTTLNIASTLAATKVYISKLA